MATHPVALLAVRVPLPAPEAVPKDLVALQAAEALGVVELELKFIQAKNVHYFVTL